MARSRSRKTGRRARHSGKIASRRSRKGAAPARMLFTRHNYMLILLGILAIVVGYTTMRIENEVDGVISLYVAPLLILGGYLEIIYAILWRPKPAANTADTAGGAPETVRPPRSIRR